MKKIKQNLTTTQNKGAFVYVSKISAIAYQDDDSYSAECCDLSGQNGIIISETELSVWKNQINCYSFIKVHREYKSRLTVKLQRKIDSEWITEKSWTECGNEVAIIDENYEGSLNENRYRLNALHEVLDLQGNVIESIVLVR